MQFQARASSPDLISQSLRATIVSFACHNGVQRNLVKGRQHRLCICLARCASRCTRPCGGSGTGEAPSSANSVGDVRRCLPSSNNCGDAAGQCFDCQLRADVYQHKLAQRLLGCYDRLQCTCASIAPAVTIIFSAAMTSVLAPTVMPSVTPSMTSGLPALPIPTMKPFFTPMSAL